MSPPLVRGTTRWSIIGLVACGALIAVVLGWGTIARVHSAVIATGSISVDDDATPIQHLAGGQIVEVLVREGELVQLGQPLLRLDPSSLEQDLRAAGTELDLLQIRIARIDAQISDAVTIASPSALHRDADDPAIVRALSSAQGQLDGWRIAIDAQIEQARRAGGGSRFVDAQIEAIRASGRLQSESEKGAAIESLAMAQERFDGIQRLLDASLITAPTEGVVFGATGLQSGRVVAAGEAIMYVSAASENLVVRAQLRPADVDVVAIGGSARIRLPGLNQRTTPELTGVVDYVSPEALVASGTGEQYFEVVIALSEPELARLPEGAVLVPGMPTEVLIATGDRSALEWMLKPLVDQFAHALREE